MDGSPEVPDPFGTFVTQDGTRPSVLTFPPV